MITETGAPAKEDRESKALEINHALNRLKAAVINLKYLNNEIAGDGIPPDDEDAAKETLPSIGNFLSGKIVTKIDLACKTIEETVSSIKEQLF